MNFHETLIERARQKRVRVVLPEPTDDRVLTAAFRADKDNIAECQLLGDAGAINACAARAGLTLPSHLAILSPQATENDISELIKIRTARGKAISADSACQLLAQPAALAALRVKDGTADAMVAGAVTASADVLRPALQIIGLQPDTSLASAAFLMCFEDGMRVFADCALNITPTADELATIALQSTDTARAFGIAPVLAMLSYASGESGSGQPVEHVAAATARVRQQLTDTLVSGPIQYDAAVSETIAKIKLPHDRAAGKATVLIFPDLQAGNITYKAVQQAAGVVSIGPLLQGLAAPVNDLSRGATAEDIYYTIAATVIQAQLHTAAA